MELSAKVLSAFYDEEGPHNVVVMEYKKYIEREYCSPTIYKKRANTQSEKTSSLCRKQPCRREEDEKKQRPVRYTLGLCKEHKTFVLPHDTIFFLH